MKRTILELTITQDEKTDEIKIHEVFNCKSTSDTVGCIKTLAAALATAVGNNNR